MDFLDFAKEIETRGIEQYNLLAQTMQLRELCSVFEFMADQERRHYEVFDSWQRNGAAANAPEIPVETVLGRAGDAFELISGHFIPDKFIPPINYGQAYEQALEFENRSIALYEETLPRIGDGTWKSVLKLIVEQEKAHAQFITDLMDFLRHPGEWLENAEWRHQEEY